MKRVLILFLILIALMMLTAVPAFARGHEGAGNAACKVGNVASDGVVAGAPSHGAIVCAPYRDIVGNAAD